MTKHGATLFPFDKVAGSRWQDLLPSLILVVASLIVQRIQMVMFLQVVAKCLQIVGCCKTQLAWMRSENPLAGKMDRDFFTNERTFLAIKRMRDHEAEKLRVIQILAADPKEAHFVRTLKRDLAKGGLEKRIASKRNLNPDYRHAVCRAFYVVEQFDLYALLKHTVVPAPGAQDRLVNMVGSYKAYWPSGAEGEFSQFPFQIAKIDDRFVVSDTTEDEHVKYDHAGFAFLIRKRVHVIEPLENGLRTMIFHYEEMPAKVAVRGIITNVLGTSEEEVRLKGEEIFAVHFIAFHERHERYRRTPSNNALIELLSHDSTRRGVIRV